MDKQKAIELLNDRIDFIEKEYPEMADYKEALEFAVNCINDQEDSITVRKLKEMTLDTDIIVRNNNTGEFFRNFTECYDKKVCKMYAKITESSKKRKCKADLVVFAK